MITREQVEKLAALARVEIAPEEAEKLAGELGSILDYAGELSKAAGSIDRTKDVPAHRNVMRDDTPVHEAGEHTETLLAAAPSREGQYFKVKKILS